MPGPSIRKQIRSAVWLLVLLVQLSPVEWVGDSSMYLNDARPINDEELAQSLGASKRLIARWRLRFRKAGVIGWLISPGLGRIYWINAVNTLLFPPAAKPQAPKPDAPQVPEPWVH